MRTAQASDPKPLSREAINKAIDFNTNNPKRCPSYNIPLPGWNNGIFVGAMVQTINGNVYTIVDIVGDRAVIVPIVRRLDCPPVAAYTALICDLTPTSLQELQSEND